MFFHRLTKIRAPEWPAKMTWLNSEPLRLARLAGKPVLLDFFTYSCVNCLRTLPHIQQLHERYREFGLTVIGVHTPEFAFEHDLANIKDAVAAAGLTYPIVVDNDYDIWHLFANRAWPHCYLIGHDGIIAYDHIGEGAYVDTERAVQEALLAAGVTASLPAIIDDVSVDDGVCYKTTPELYLGYLRGRYGNKEEFLPDVPEAFTNHGLQQEDLPYLHGHWQVTGEYVEHSRELSVASEYLALKYSAYGVNLVLEADAKTQLIIELDGLPLADDMLGADVKRAKDGSSVATIQAARLYNLVKSSSYHQATLSIKLKASGVRFYAFTFDSSC